VRRVTQLKVACCKGARALRELDPRRGASLATLHTMTSALRAVGVLQTAPCMTENGTEDEAHG